jgi:hypothetical protein
MESGGMEVWTACPGTSVGVVAEVSSMARGCDLELGRSDRVGVELRGGGMQPRSSGRCRPGAGQSKRVSTSIVMTTSLPTTRPPLSIWPLQFTPKSCRLMEVVA